MKYPKDWRIYRARDYGLDMCATLWIAMDYHMNIYAYKELYESDLIVSEAARKINAITNEKIQIDYAPPDLWNRNKDTGKSTADIFAENGQYLTKADNNRITGWLAVHEWLRVFKDEQGQPNSKLKIFSNCVNLIRTLPALQIDIRIAKRCGSRTTRTYTHTRCIKIFLHDVAKSISQQEKRDLKVHIHLAS